MKGKSGMAGAGGGEIEKSLRYYGRLRARNTKGGCRFRGCGFRTRGFRTCRFRARGFWAPGFQTRGFWPRGFRARDFRTRSFWPRGFQTRGNGLNVRLRDFPAAYPPPGS